MKGLGKLTNIETLSEKRTLQGVIDRVSIKKVTFLIHVFFFSIALFLSHAVMFDAAVPFLLPLWAIVRKRYENEKWWVLFGGIVGAATLSIGQVLILCLQIVLYELIRRFKYWN